MKIKDLFENDYKDDIDKAIDAYSNDAFKKSMLSVKINDAIARYPNTQSETLYRGLNFDTKEEYEAFISSIKDNQITLNEISSWSPSYQEAKSFAFTKPSYMEFMTKEKMAQIDKQNKEGERITGYRGIILKTKIPANTGLDMRNTSYSKENEIILPSGTYSVEIEDIKSFKDMMDQTNVNEIIANMDVDNDDKNEMMNFIEFMIRNDASDFNEQSKEKIAKILELKPFVYDLDKSENRFDEENTHKIIVSFRNMDHLNRLLPYLPKKVIEELRSKSINKFNKMLKEIESIYKEGDVIEWANKDIRGTAEFLKMDDALTKTLSNTVGKEYRKRNSREYNKSVTDPKKEAERITKLLKSMQ